ncbi:hypothetical protein RQP46_000348 [Phenoliferia psychrophenolica]
MPSVVAAPDAESVQLAAVPTKRFASHRDKVRALAWSVDGRRLASGGSDKAIRIWQPEKDSRGTASSLEMKGHASEVSAVRWDPTHPEHLVSCSAATGTAKDPGVYFWDIRQPKPTDIVQSHGENLNITWSPDGKTVVVGDKHDRVTWIDVATKKVIKEVKSSLETNEFLFSHNGSLMFTTQDGQVDISAYPSGETIHRVKTSPVATMSLDLDPKGRYLAAGSNDATVTLWETTEWTCVRSLGYHDDPIRTLRFSHDGRYIASTAGEREVHISAIPSGKKMHTIATFGLCDAIAWHPTKHLLAYAADEMENGRSSGSFRIWGM